MPTDYSGTILFERDQAKALVALSYAPGFQEVQDFVGVLATMTTADIRKCTFTQSTDPQLNGNGQEYAALSLAAHFKLRRVDPEADVRFRSFRLPAPKLDLFDHIPGVGYRIKQSYGDTLAAAFSTLFQEDFVFDSGWLVN